MLLEDFTKRLKKKLKEFWGTPQANMDWYTEDEVGCESLHEAMFLSSAKHL